MAVINKKKSFYINKYGVKSSKKLDLIIDKTYDYIYGGKGYNSNKFNTLKMQKFREQFQREAKLIGGVGYTLGDTLA